MTQKDYLLQIDSVIANGKFKDNNASLCTHTPPEWYKNAKFGIFIHWGVYSVPGYSNGTAGKCMTKQNRHTATISKHTAIKRISDIRILFRCLRAKTFLPTNG